uniref:Inositol polyphosphate-related phosphatase domain-containing protein n=1 Tax=Periophthalmus magnuspinnatus TaxID=409849 RepID=A0A3B4AWV6_9GOBI
MHSIFLIYVFVMQLKSFITCHTLHNISIYTIYCNRPSYKDTLSLPPLSLLLSLSFTLSRVHSLMLSHTPSHSLSTSLTMQGVLLLVFAKYFHLPFLRGVQTETTRTGLGGYWGNKGGVSARMSVFGHTLCFLNCHLPAHMENSEQRMDDFESILQQQQFEGQAATGVLDHDVVFWFGDLNFRIDDLDMQVVKSAIDNNKYSTLWEKDQLNMAKDCETVLEGFQEGPLKFPPTYKFDVGTDMYDTSGKKRKPAWTDRILWRLRATAPGSADGKRNSISGLTSGTRVTQHYYRSHMEYTVSDHKPVSAIFTLQVRWVDVPLVTLIVEDEWNCAADATAKFRLAPNYSRSSWDWIGLYKVQPPTPCSYASLAAEKLYSASFIFFLPKGSGDFILGYYSNNMNSIVGVTEPFQVQPLSTVYCTLSMSTVHCTLHTAHCLLHTSHYPLHTAHTFPANYNPNTEL